MLNAIKNHGIIGSIEHFFQKRKLWSITKEEAPKGYGSSVSDSSKYLQIIDDAVRNEVSFARFRSNREYREILEHVSKSLGYKYIKEMGIGASKIKKLNSKIAFLNAVGMPLVYFYPRIGILSPTTLRYLKVYRDLDGLFPNLNKMNIAEIGGGFGGQAAILRKLSGFVSYTIYDLPEVLKLQSKFLKSNNLEDDISYADGRFPPSHKFDLVISNYALSELNRGLQIVYFENVVKSSDRGYITWNLISQKKLGGLSLEEVLQYIPNANFIQEAPLTDDGNVLITWGNLPG